MRTEAASTLATPPSVRFNEAVSAIPDPAVPADVYDETYYREWCAGYETWSASGGREVAGIYPGFLARARLRPGEVVVDVGTGRGELLAVAVEMGAHRAYGLEYSKDAVALARTTLAIHGVEDRAEVLLADARSETLPEGIADLVCYVDVVEHLTPDELHDSLVQARRVLRPGGRVVAHTFPSRLIYDVTYRWLRAVPGHRRWPADPRKEFERVMHVNEHSPSSLTRAFEEAGFDVEVELGAWVYTDFVPTRTGRGVYRALARCGPLAKYGIGDLWAFAEKPAR